MTANFERLMEAQRRKDMLRFIICGSVDDGKSTLLGRLLHDSRHIMEDQLANIENDSRRYGTTGKTPDLALLVDGLQAEREQGITIDVAYRYFETEKRKFIVADTPGHEQYTRNMATGASTADAAVILIDARKGLLPQTKRHSLIVSLMGIRHVVLAVNKMDLLDWNEERFAKILQEYTAFSQNLKFSSIAPIPLSALQGDNVISSSANMPWYSDPTLIAHLGKISASTDDKSKPFRLPVQCAVRTEEGFRGYCGTIAGGSIRPGDPILVMPSSAQSKIERIVKHEGDLDTASTGQSVTVTLTDDIDVARGDVLISVNDPPALADQLAAHVIWMSETPLIPGRAYIMRIGAATVTAEVTNLKHRINIETQAHEAAKRLGLNEIGMCNLALDRPVAIDRYEDFRDTGGFILIDRITNETAGAGMVLFPLRRAANIVWQPLTVNKESRARIKDQKPCVLWFTGLSGSGKSTIADIVEQKLFALGRHTYLLDGDNIRHGLNKDLGFTEEDRVENIRRVAETAKLFADAGLIVLVSFISPFAKDRLLARERMQEGEFFEIFVDTPLEECEHRDPKNLYKKAREGKIVNFTGIDSPYEPPQNPELVVDTLAKKPEEAAQDILALLRLNNKI